MLYILIFLWWQFCSGDTDGRVPVTSTQNSINTMKLPIKTPWHAWYHGGEVNFTFIFFFLSLKFCAPHPIIHFGFGWIKLGFLGLVQLNAFKLTVLNSNKARADLYLSSTLFESNPAYEWFICNDFWYSFNIVWQVGGYTQVYKGDLTFATVRGAGHQVPSYQPKRALSLVSHFLNGSALPNTSRYT